MNAEWGLWCLVAVMSWGLYGFFSRLATEKGDWMQFMIFFTAGAILAGAVVYACYRPSVSFVSPGSCYGLLSGIASSIGVAAVFLAFERGSTSIVITASALYPVVTIVLSVIFLNERLTFPQSFGIILALIAVVFMTR